MEAKALDHLQNGDWVRAAEIYNQLLGFKNLSKQQIVAYLLGRSECFLELGQLEAVISDCRRIFNYQSHSRAENGIDSKARRRLVQALFSLRKFAEAELEIREWIASKGGPDHEQVSKVLERLHKALRGANGNKKPIEIELLACEAALQTMDYKKMEIEDQSVSCTYCGITFKDKVELRGHCQTEAHQRVIMSDEGRDWLWRAPPRGLGTETYAICESWMETGVCRYGSQCIEAHGTDELQEWNERFEYRRMKLQRAYDTELYGKSYTEELIDKLIQTTIPDKIMKEQLPDIDCACSNKLATTISTKFSDQEWIFTLTSKRNLKAVALLQDTHRNYFYIDRVQFDKGKLSSKQDVSNRQEWISKTDAVDVTSCTVKIAFEADIYGTFRQSVIFDFGTQPVLVKHLCVDVIPVTDIEKINEIRKEVVVSSNERWNNANCEIVVFTSPLQSLVPSYGNMESDWAKHLSAAYPCPHADSFALSQATIVEKRLTKNNYRSRMHELLCIEEMARYDRIARFNVIVKLRIAHSYLLSPNSTASSTAKYSNSGELFALMNLGKDLSEDTSAGRLILTNCTTVLLAPETSDEMVPPKVYEALIEDKGKTTIYLRLSSLAVNDMNLVTDQEIKCNVQFQLNRIPYCEWHYAIDKIPDFKIIFPETYLEPNIPWTPARQWSDTLDAKLNLKQKEAVVAITTPLYVHLPPVLIIGPFGTGKTYTLAQAIKQLMLQPENRILICTQSNSAADLYIKDYLHPYVESGHEEARPLRIYYHKRWVATVNQTVQKYCMIDSNGTSRSFRVPTVEDIMKHRIIVVTLSISMYLSTIDLPRGFFTHIILDEAAQAMECEAIMPLALANQNTRIVLAGDHMQLSPELFSQFAKERNLHVSLLERLYDHYPTTFPCKILLSENYRAHESIVQFTSESFYDQKLISSGKQPRHDMYYPLTFFTTRGEDVQDLNSTAFYNNSEVYEIVERVQELKKNWPTAWGKFDDQSIGIMTPYSDQVLRIRSELRKRRMYGISVERVLNVQGKQFRAIFLSTVRTRRTCTMGKTNEDSDYGFLSNSKLLNTAITRAQSLVAVVGDPIALCSIGRCSKVWERFIQICEENRSLFGITWSSLKNQLDGVELKKTYVLNPLAPEFIPRKYQQEAFIRNGMPQIGGANVNYQPMLRFPVVPPPFASPPVIETKLKLPPPRIFPVYNQMAPPAAMYPIRPAMTQPWPLNIAPPPRPLSIPQAPPPRPFIKEAIMPPLVQQQPIPFKLPEHLLQKPPEDKSLIQFFNNVHFPEAPKLQTACSLNEYINLLPPNTSLADMLQQPFARQERWYYHLLETKGIDAARKFEFLIHATTKKEPDKPTIQRPVSTSYLQASVPNLNFYNKPVNQLNFEQSVYLKDFEQKFNSQPLYKRQSEMPPMVPPPIPVVPPQHNDQLRQQHWQQQINADFANLSLDNSSESVDDIFKQYNNSVSYASVVRTQQNKPCEPPKMNMVSNVRGEPSANGPRLYQYF